MDLFSVIIIIAVISVCLAFFSLWRQGKIDHVKKVKKELNRKKVIFYAPHRSVSHKKD